MRRCLLLGLFFFGVVLLQGGRPGTTTAAAFVFETEMHGDQQVPPIETVAWGFVRFFFNEDRSAADYTVDIKGLSRNIVTGADIHRGVKGVNGPVIHHLADGGFLTTSGRMRFSKSDLAEMARGLWYVSLSSVEYPDGEIRGQVALPPGFIPQPTPTAVVPGSDPPAVSPCLVDCGPGASTIPIALPNPPEETSASVKPPSVASNPPPPPLPPAPVVEPPPVGAIHPPNTGDGGLDALR